MCFTATLAGSMLLGSAASSLVSSLVSSKAEYRETKYVERLKQKQLSEQAEVTRLAAAQQELSRGRQYMSERSSALAAIGASGLGDHISFFQGLEPSNRDQFNDEVRAIRLNLTHEESQIADSIQVSEFTSKMAKFNMRMSQVGAAHQFATDVASAFAFYGANASGGAGAAKGG